MEKITAQNIAIGKQIEPLKRVYTFSPDEYEEFITEWLEIKKGNYFRIERLGGSGDMGRDVVAYCEDPQHNPDNYEWDCYQCKRYNTPLAPKNVWVEFGKIIYYSFIKEYPLPRNYYFVASKGIGTKLSNLLNNPNSLRGQLKTNWNSKCKNEIIKNKDIELEGEFLGYYNKVDFSIFKKISPKIVIEEHKAHSNHLFRFGGGLPARSLVEQIPSRPAKKELRYVEQLVLAYNSHSSKKINNYSEIGDFYLNHFKRARESFYYAEELRNFTRDNLPIQVFDDFKENIFQGVINEAEDIYENGYKKVKMVEDAAAKIPIESNPLREVCNTIDKKGVCHQLVNDNRITWISDDE